MSENFAELFAQSLEKTDLRAGALVKAVVVDVRADHILVDAGLKSEGLIPRQEFGVEIPAVGDTVEVVVKKAENGFGETRLSREEARRAKVWDVLEKASEENETVIGIIIERVKGGFTVELDTVRAFLPGSLVDVKPVRDPGYLEGKPLEFKIIKMDKRRNNVVVSRRAVMEAESSAERHARLSELQEGDELVGVVKNITDYGAFVDLGGVDGLLHITDISWKRIKHPSEALTIGDEVRVKVLKFDREKNRVSLGMKQLGEDPWVNIARRYPMNSRLFGKITNVTDYGCFVQVEEGVEGLVHMSELDWTNKNVHPSKIVQVGEDVEVMVLDINEERRRISLGIKQCRLNPWAEFSGKHEKGEKIQGKIRSITDFGVFVGLDGGIDGLIHLSDISWTETGEDAVRQFKKGDEVTAVILAIDPERERISLGIKQMDVDPLSDLMEAHKDKTFSATVKEVDSKQALVEIEAGTMAVLRLSDYTYDRLKDLREALNMNDTVDVKVVGTDPKTRQLLVSHKVFEERPDAKGKRNLGDSPAASTTLGDLLKEQMQQKDQ
ncbi:MAG: 30S ribosomal protein S1 [Gammaproteobacteria bacterium RIFCSPHIGHO2_12_FULL_45_9]|nr:MAG: 30S ribosomal protein S1 [Gammaproteobacteria bacterium RIFCSPHIGHO2_12_FULL_45_9]